MVDLNSLYYEQKGGAANAPVDLNSLYQAQKGEVDLNNIYHSKINLDKIEQIESAGKNDAISSTGAKGLYQFMPDTAAQYSKRLFGTATRDASTLSPAQQKAMANAYFNDLLKEFNGNADEAIAAYNWGQGNVEKDVKEHGSDWEEYAPKETRDYLNKYHDRKTYDHAEDESMTSGEYMKNQFKQIGDLWKGGVAEINKLTGNEYSQHDINEAEDALNSGEGKAMKASAATAASIVAPELIPELAAGAEAGVMAKGATIGANMLTKGLASSLAYQGVENGSVSLSDTLKDLETGAALEGGLRVVAAPVARQIGTMFNKLVEAGKENPELSYATRKYLAHSRAVDLGKHWKNLRETSPKATLLDAYNQMYEAVPELFESPEAVEELKQLTRPYKNNGSHSEFLDAMKEGKATYMEQARTLAKSDKERRLLQSIAEANDEIGKVLIPGDVVKSTLLQKIGETAGDVLGYSEYAPIKKAQALKKLKPQTDSLIKDIQSDTRRIRRERAKIANKTGASITSKRKALSAQERLNREMIAYLRDGMKGKKVRINDLAQAIKDVQEGQFNEGKFSNITKRFQNISDKMDAFNLTKIKSEEGIVAKAAKGVAKHAVKQSIHAVTGLATHGASPVIATVAGKAAKASKAANLAFASKLAKSVEDGTMTEAEAKKAISDYANKKAVAAGKMGASIRGLL